MYICILKDSRKKIKCETLYASIFYIYSIFIVLFYVSSHVPFETQYPVDYFIQEVFPKPLLRANLLQFGNITHYKC